MEPSLGVSHISDAFNMDSCHYERLPSSSFLPPSEFEAESNLAATARDSERGVPYLETLADPPSELAGQC